eukprot:7514182-Alexandrium_andersonii.AAC.1
MEFIGRPCRCGQEGRSQPGHAIAGAIRIGADGYRVVALTVGLTAAPGQHVIRILAHDAPAKDAIAALDALRRQWAGRRTVLRT